MYKRKGKKIHIKKGRIIFIIVGLLFLFSALLGRLFYIMTIQGKEYKVLATNQWLNKVILPPTRGKILDRNGQELAISLDVYKVEADLSILLATLLEENITVDTFSLNLSKILNLDVKDVSKILKSTNSAGEPLKFVSIKRRVEKQQADAIKALKLSGFIITPDIKRYYPNNNFLAQVIGHTNAEGVGVNGVESSYNDILKGSAGVRLVEKDSRKNDLPYSEEQVTNPINGKNIMLTIDEKIQEMTETVAEEALKTNKAKSVSITVMNPKNGEILAMVNKPDYDPNNPNKGASSDKLLQEMWKNRAVENVFEPGSIFKVITAAAAMKNNSVKVNDKFNCTGSIIVNKRILYCDEGKAHGIESFSDIIKNSCNVGFIQLGQKIGKDNFLDFIQLMGLNKRTGIDLPGDSSGVLRDAKSLNEVEMATLSYGHGIAITQIQYMAAFNAIANGGTLITPHVMKAIMHNEEDKNVIDGEFNNYEKRTVIGKQATDELRGYLERVVKEGTATATFIDGYHIAGKTGTAVKVNTVTGGYDEGKYVSSFVGMAPASDPTVTLIVTIDEPNPLKYYAGETAVPAAKKLFTSLFNYLPSK